MSKVVTSGYRSLTLGRMTAAVPICAIVPPYVLDRLAEAGHEAAAHTLTLDAAHRAARLSPPPATGGAPGLNRVISDAGHGQRLPGRTVRTEGQAAVSDASVNHAYDGLGATFALYADVFGRHSIDDRGLRLDASVHYGRNYDNAFWNGHQMVFGDGDGRIFGDFTACIDVIGHELTHGVTQFTAGLDYQDQPGALNESVSDVFGSLVKQYALHQSAADADWLIGAGLLAPGIQGVALRSMKAPGTAYDDPQLGKDPQPAHMRDYVNTSEDNGGVHINSGIPNHAFYLLATALGGSSWERAGRIWYDALTGHAVPADADFAAFARATVAAAKARYPDQGAVADTVTASWAQVGVSPG
ncbi:thermolysin metallopeptidase-like protein [Streptomyces sp. 1114.5]|nr:thermolysin metallopeptidase-like protein [Streptomyces sp. 1114.5]